LPVLTVRFICLLLVASPLFSPVAFADWHGDEQEKMGTRVEVQLWHEDPVEAQRLVKLAMVEFDRIEALMSTYLADSEMSRVNATAHEKPVQVSAELFALLQVALEVSELTDGAFDISYDSVGALYDFRARQKPSADEIADHLDEIDYRLIELDDADYTVSFAAVGVRINLGGIAKGYAVESVIAILAQEGVQNALATAGGDTRLLGDRRDKPWIIGIRDPDSREGVFTRLALDNEAISTSGDYERFFVEDGVRYHHILRPADGKPVDDVRSVSVIGPDATMTDALSTSIFVLGPEEGLDLIARMPDYEAVVITSEQLFYSDGLNPG
jgi:thiamine biosynthesis lipoprotein